MSIATMGRSCIGAESVVARGALRAGVLAATLITAIGMAACASLPPPPTVASEDEYQYKLGPGDQIKIVVWRNPELSAEIPVRPDGKITAPLIEDMVALGKTPSALAREIEAELDRFVRNASVRVLVTRFVGSQVEQVRVVGQATRPTALPYTQKMTLLDVMIAVGGLTEWAAGNRAVLIRSAQNNKQYGVRLADLIQDGDVTANAEVLPGDVIMIPESRF